MTFVSFDIQFHFYGFFVGLGILIGAWVAEKINHKFQITNYQFPITNLLPWGLVPGIIGARLYHVADYWWYYSENPLQIVFLWNGGLGIYGGILGAIVGIWIFLKLKIKKSKIKNSIKN